MTKARLYFLLLLMGTCPSLFGQQSSSFVQAAYQNAVAQYPPLADYQSVLYNGSEYKEPNQTEGQHPFYVLDDWQTASIIYDKVRFERVDALYDLYIDELVVEHKNGAAMRLVKEKVKEFELAGRRFINITAKDSMSSLPRSGFYQVVHDGPTMCVARWAKHRNELITQGKIEILFPQKVTFYVWKNHTFTNVNARSSLLRLLQDQKPKLKRFISKEKIKFKDDRESAISKILTYYDSLNAD